MRKAQMQQQDNLCIKREVATGNKKAAFGMKSVNGKKMQVLVYKLGCEEGKSYNSKQNSPNKDPNE
jgi:hypothetical protein